MILETPLTERAVYLGDDWHRSPTGLFVPARASKAERYPLPVGIDLFSGAGGFSLGTHQSGFHVVAAMDNSPEAAITYLHNLGDRNVRIHFDSDESRDRFTKVLERQWGLTKKSKGLVRATAVSGSGWISHYGCTEPMHDGIGYDGQPSEYLAAINRAPLHPYGCEHYFFGDARNFTGAQILEALGLERGDVDYVFGGPPCQGFSTSGRRNVYDPRNSLVFEFARLVVEILPKAFAMENVPAIASMVTPDGIPVMEALALYLETGGMGDAGRLLQSLKATSGAGAAIKNNGRPTSMKRRSIRRVAEPEEVAPESPDFEQVSMFAEAAR